MEKVHPKFRRAVTDDADRIAEMYLASRKLFLGYAPLAHTDTEIRAWVQYRLIPSNGVTVAESERGIEGFLAVSTDTAGNWIDHLYLDPAFVGGGLGSLLIAHAKESLPIPIRLYTFQQNEGARRLYRRHGFREVASSDGSGNEEKTPDVLMEWP